MKVICGLGNPGSEYEDHRHNIGFRVVERLASRARTELNHQKFDARLAQVSIAGEKCLLLEPQTFMNLSGRAVVAACQFYKVPSSDVLVIHDELDLPFGRLQLKSGGGAGGHNGLRSITELSGTDAFARLRFGVGKPQGANPRERVVGHVLGGFSREEQEALAALVDRASDIVECWVGSGISVAMNRFNRAGGSPGTAKT